MAGIQGAIASVDGANAPTGDTPDIKELFQNLLGHVKVAVPEGGVRPNADPPEHVLVEMVVDEVRYTLTCSPQPAHDTTINLTPREQEIVRLVAKGLPNKAIAAVLDISPWTVATHIRRIFRKLAVSSRAEMVARALQQGLT